MAKIYNSEVTKDLANNAGIQQNIDKVPNELAEKIVPTFESNPELFRKCNVIITNTAVNATNATIYTTPKDRDFYLVGASLSVIKDAGSTSTETSINVQTDETNTTQRFLSIIGLSGVAQSETISISLPYPLKLRRNTIQTLTNSTNNANISARGVLYGYYLESRDS